MSHGTFVWHDVMSTAPEKARRFYTELFGWSAIDHPTPEGNYTLFHLGDRKVGGMVGVDPKGNVPSHWMPYVSVPKLEEALEKSRELGAKVVFGPMGLPDVGRWAVVQDPQGGYVSPFEAAAEMCGPAGDLPPVGAFCWEELNSTDPAASVRFYTSLFGWKAESMQLDPLGVYTLLHAGPAQIGGVAPVQGPPMTYWLSYVHVADVDASSRRAENLGGRVLVPPENIPDIGRFSVIADPAGAVLAFYKSVRM